MGVQADAVGISLSHMLILHIRSTKLFEKMERCGLMLFNLTPFLPAFLGSSPDSSLFRKGKEWVEGVTVSTQCFFSAASSISHLSPSPVQALPMDCSPSGKTCSCMGSSWAPASPGADTVAGAWSPLWSVVWMSAPPPSSSREKSALRRSFSFSQALTHSTGSYNGIIFHPVTVHTLLFKSFQNFLF